MSDITSDHLQCDKCCAERTAACSVHMCAKCCIANCTECCVYNHHHCHKLWQAPQTVVPPSSTSPPIPDPPAAHPSSQSTTVVSATSIGDAASLHSTISSSHPGTFTITFAAPLTSLLTPNQAIWCVARIKTG